MSKKKIFCKNNKTKKEMDFFCLFQIATQTITDVCSYWICFPLRYPCHPYHRSRKALCMQRRCSRKRIHWASLCNSLRCDTAFRSCCNALDSRAPRRESPWPGPPGPGPARSAAGPGGIPGSPSAWWPFHLKGRYCRWKHGPRCLMQDLKTKQN